MKEAEPLSGVCGVIITDGEHVSRGVNDQVGVGNHESAWMTTEDPFGTVTTEGPFLSPSTIGGPLGEPGFYIFCSVAANEKSWAT